MYEYNLFVKNRTLSERLRFYLKRDNMTGKQLAEQLGVSKSTVSLWLSGKNEPREKYFEAICDIFDVNYLQLTMTEEELAAGYLGFLFQKYNLDSNDFDNLPDIVEKLGNRFLDIIGNYRKDKSMK